MIGIFGGTFDPVHYGHLRPVAEVRRALELAEVRFIPCAAPPHRAPPAAGCEQRLAMLELALAAHDAFQVDDREIRLGGISYSVRTLEDLRVELGDRSLCLIVGADAFLGFETWYRWRDIPELAHIVVMSRPGWPLEEGARNCPAWAQARLTHDPAKLRRVSSGLVLIQPVTPVDLSATGIRRAIANGEDVGAMLPAPVWSYIRDHRLYGWVSDASGMGKED